VGVRNAQAELIRLPDGSYSIRSGAELGFETFSVAGSFEIVYDPPSSIGLRRVRIEFRGSIPYAAIPVGNTGFYITGVSGGFDLTSGTLQVEFGVHGAYAYEVAGIALFSADAKTTITFQPFEIVMQGEGKFIGIPVSQDTTRITRTSFRTDGMVENQLWRGIVSLAFGKDAANEFTVYGKAELEVGLRKGSIGCFAFLCLPPVDFTLARQGFDAGKFNQAGNQIWGARTYAHLFGLQVFVLARFAPGIGVDAGTNLNAYQPVLPAISAAGVAGLITYEADVNGPATRITVGEAITFTNRAAPEPLLVIRPDGNTASPLLVYESADRSLRTYAIELADPASAIGGWFFRTQTGNGLMVWGADPPARIDHFTVATSSATLAPLEQQPTTRLTVAAGENFQISWSASNNEAGLAAELFAVDAHGVRHPIAGQRTEDASQLSGDMAWTPTLPSGVYTLTLQVDDFKHPLTTSQKEPLTLHDVTPPTAPRNLQAQTQMDGVVALTWDGEAAAADVVAYQVEIDGRPPLTEQGRQSQLTLYGLSLGAGYPIALRAVDATGNVGAAATVEVTLPSVGVVATYPRRAEQLQQVNELWVTFNRPITPTSFNLVDEANQAVVGALTLITKEVEIDSIQVIGVRFTPKSAPLASGGYTAALTFLGGEHSAASTFNWPFTVVASAQNASKRRLYLPVVVR
jgi:hypothetical protein